MHAHAHNYQMVWKLQISSLSQKELLLSPNSVFSSDVYFDISK